MSNAANTKIAELIKTNPGYSAQVDLNRWFRNNAANLASMRRYKPIASHRKAFEKIAGALDNKDKRAYLITGNYGSGKSHLALMLANYFAYPSDQPDIESFLENYADEDPSSADKLRARRRKGRFLVALCDWDSSDDFAEVVLRAILDALQDAGLTDVLDTPYQQAQQKLERLEAEQKSGQALVDYFKLFEQQLPSYQPGVTMSGFKDRLYPKMQRDALDAFKRLHEAILRSPFTYEAGNLSAILSSTLESEAFRERFEGMVIFWDEFGYTLSDPSRLSLNVFQQFTQLCAEFDPARGKLIFISTAHKDFSAYAPAWAAADYSKIKDRLEPVSLLPEGLEDVIGAIVSPDREHALWQSSVLPQAGQIWSQWLPASKSSGIFKDLVNKPPVFRQKILEGVYPMHPMATYSAIELARLVASQNRTVFTFFSSEKDDVYEDGSYLWYINSQPVVDGIGRLNFYTVDLLFEYFRPRLNTGSPDLTPKAKERISHYEAALTQLQRAHNQQPLELAETVLIERVMRAMLLYDLIGVTNSLENLTFGMNIPPNERPVVESQLKELARFGVIHRNPSTQLYEFRRSDIFDVDRVVEEYKREEGEKLGNLAVELASLAPFKGKDQYLEAKGYNAQHNEDKRLDRRVVTPSDLAVERTIDGKTLTYLDVLEDEVARQVASNGQFEGIALYVLCETQADIARAKDLVAKSPARRVAVAVPRTPVAFKDAILNLKAVGYIRKLPEAESFSTQDNALVLDRERVFQKKLEEQRDKLTKPENVIWYTTYGKVLPADASKPDDAANKLMQQLYTRRTVFSHDDFNRTHDVRNFTKQAPVLTEAVNALLKVGQDLTIDQRKPDNTGEKRYLLRCLHQRGALDRERQQGSIWFVEVQRNPAKYADDLPALADMIGQVQKLGERDRISLRSFVDTYRQPPYGLGEIALSLLLATVLRYFGDTIKIKKEDTAIGDLYVADFEMVADIIKGNYPNAFIRYREIRPGERELISGVHVLFSNAHATSASQGNVTTINAYDAIAAWYGGLAPVAQVADFYSADDSASAVRLLEALDKLRSQDPHAFVLGELQMVAGRESTELVTSARAKEILNALKQAKDQIESTLERVHNAIRDGLCDVFGVQGNTWDDVAVGVRDWYNNLDANQRSTTSPWHTDASKPLAQLFLDLSSPRDLFLDKLPNRPSYGFGRVRDWNADLTKDYMAKIRDGVRHIGANKIKVLPAKAELGGTGKHRRDKDNVFFSGELTLTLSHSDPTVCVFVTDTGKDPIDSKERSEFKGSNTFDIWRLAQYQQSTLTIKYVPQDVEGNWGVVETITFFDETRENEIRKPQRLLREGGSVVKFVFPEDEIGFVTSCRTFFESILDNHVVDRNKLRTVVEEVLDSLTRDAGEE